MPHHRTLKLLRRQNAAWNVFNCCIRRTWRIWLLLTLKHYICVIVATRQPILYEYYMTRLLQEILNKMLNGTHFVRWFLQRQCLAHIRQTTHYFRAVRTTHAAAAASDREAIASVQSTITVTSTRAVSRLLWPWLRSLLSSAHSSLDAHSTPTEWLHDWFLL